MIGLDYNTHPNTKGILYGDMVWQHSTSQHNATTETSTHFNTCLGFKIPENPSTKRW